MDALITLLAALLGAVAGSVASGRWQHERAREAVLSDFHDRMLALITEQGLKEQPDRSAICRHARSLTLSTLDQLDPGRRVHVFRYLAEQGLIRSPGPIIEIQGANLSKADLTTMQDFGPVDILGCNLREANLRGIFLAGSYLGEVDFTGADLAGARLQQTKLENANFGGADLTDVFMPRAELHGVNFAGTTLTRADLTDADFLDVSGLTQRQLNSTQSYRGAKNLPAHLKPDTRSTE